MTSGHRWAFKTRFRASAYSWHGSALASKRLDEAVREINSVAKSDRVSAANGERQLECRRLDGIEIVAPLLDRMREVVNFRLIRLLIQVLEQNQRAVPLGMTENIHDD